MLKTLGQSGRAQGYHPAPAIIFLPRELSTTSNISNQASNNKISVTTNKIFIMAVEPPPNPLLSSQKTSDTGLQVALHPLVLLTISDYITRHTLRQQKGPVVGALLGQQNGREITIEHAFECLLEPVDNGEIILNQAWFEERLQQSMCTTSAWPRHIS